MATGDLARKVADPALLAVAESDAQEQVPVLIQVDIPTARVEMRQDPRTGRRIFVDVVTPKPEEQEAIEEQIAQAGVFLQQLLGSQPVWIGAAKAFIATVSGRQLREIVRSPLIKAIMPNRRLLR
jgi:hypothetical protein